MALEEENAFASAVSRLPYPVFLLDSESHLRALNTQAEDLWNQERMNKAQLERWPSHPLSIVLRSLRAGEIKDDEPIDLLLRGIRYEVIHSTQSPRGAGRWFIVMLRPFPTERVVDAGVLRKRWSLTPREAQVAAACIAGHTTSEMCQSLSISRETLKTHVGRLLRKTNCQNRSQLIAKYLFGD